MTGTAFLQDPLVYAIEHYTDMVLRLAAHYAPNLSDVEDVVQDVFEKLVRFEKGFENEEHLRAWLIRVTSTTATPWPAQAGTAMWSFRSGCRPAKRAANGRC